MGEHKPGNTTMASAAAEIPVPQHVFSSKNHCGKLAQADQGQMGEICMKREEEVDEENRNRTKNEISPNGKQGSDTGSGIVYLKGATQYAKTVEDYFTGAGRIPTLCLCDDFGQFKSAIKDMSRSTLYILVEEDFFKMQEINYPAVKKLFTETTHSPQKLYFVNYLEQEDKYQEVKYKLPEGLRDCFLPRENFIKSNNGITEDNRIRESGHFKDVRDSDGFKGSMIGRDNTFNYESEASLSGIVLTVRTPEGNHHLDVSIKTHIDDNKEHINIALKDLHAEVESTQLGSVIIKVKVEKGTKLSSDWLKKLITTILPDDIMSRLHPGAMMEINIQASLPLKPLDVNIFDLPVEAKTAMKKSETVVKEFTQFAKSARSSWMRMKYLMHQGVNAGTAHIIEELLAAGFHIDERGEDNNTPLHIAARLGNVEMIDFLLRKGADVHALNNSAVTPLHMAVKSDSTECIEHLWLAANPNKPEWFDKLPKDAHSLEPTHNPTTPSRQIAVKLLTSNANAEAKDSSHNTPLHYAAAVGNIGVVEELISYGADAKSINLEKQTPLHVALATGNLNCGMRLAFPDTVTSTDNDGNTPLHVINRNREIRVRHDLYSKRIFRYPSIDLHKALDISGRYIPDTHIYRGGSALHTAVQYEKINAIHALIKLGEDVNAVNKKKQTPLHLASSKSVNDKSLPNQDENVLKNILSVFLKHNGNINAQNRKGNTILHNAALMEDEKFVMDLVELGADVSIVNNEGETVFHVLAKTHWNPISLIESLFQTHGESLNIKDKDGNTPLHKAINRRNIGFAIALIKAGANFNIKNEKGISPKELLNHHDYEFGYLKRVIKLKEISSDVQHSDVHIRPSLSGITLGGKETISEKLHACFPPTATALTVYSRKHDMHRLLTENDQAKLKYEEKSMSGYRPTSDTPFVGKISPPQP